MKKYSAIQEMYYGRRGDGQLIKPNAEYKEQANKMVEIAERLKEKLKEDKEGLELLEQLYWVSAGMEATATDTHYREGFSFGILIGLEVAGTR